MPVQGFEEWGGDTLCYIEESWLELYEAERNQLLVHIKANSFGSSLLVLGFTLYFSLNHHSFTFLVHISWCYLASFLWLSSSCWSYKNTSNSFVKDFFNDFFLLRISSPSSAISSLKETPVIFYGFLGTRSLQIH